MTRILSTVARTLALLVLVLTLVGCGLHAWNSRGAGPAAPGDGLRLATHNVHYIILGRQTGPWSVGDWEARRGALNGAFGALDADIVAFQEMESFGGGSMSTVNLAMDWLLRSNPGYAAAAQGDPAAFPSTQPIFYRTDRVELLEQGWFFFSDTPDAIYSRTFNGSYPAFASWARFASGGRPFYVVNVHFEWSSGSNRLKSAELVSERIAPWIAAGDPVILAGDLNALHGAPTMKILQEAGLVFPEVPGATYHFDLGLNLFGAIDHIGATPDVALSAPSVLRGRFNGDWPSDHYPVLVDVTVAP